MQNRKTNGNGNGNKRGIPSSGVRKAMRSVDVKSALRNGHSSARARVQLQGEPAARFHSLLQSTGISADSAATALLSAVLLENTEIQRMISESATQPGNNGSIRHMSFAQLRKAYRKHLITKEELESYLLDLWKKHSGSLGSIATNAFQLKDGRAKKSFYSWVRFLRVGQGFRLPTTS